MESSSVQKFFNTNQYKIMALLFFGGIFFARTEFADKVFATFKQETEEEFKKIDEKIDYNEGATKRRISNSEEKILLKTEVIILKLELKRCQKLKE